MKEEIKEHPSPENLGVFEPMSVALFLDEIGRTTSLPPEIAKNPVLLEQASRRRSLYSQLSSIFEKVKDVTLDMDQAIERGLVSAEDLDRLYQNLADLLEIDENNARIILYLPFELLSQGLVQVEPRFCSLYKKAWIRLLFESDVRASFTDGDVLEPGMGKPERARKAAHLIPEILKRGLVSMDEIAKLLELSSEEELLRSINEGLIVAAEKGKARGNKEHASQSFEEIVNRLEQDLTDIDELYSSLNTKRARWEKEVKEDESITRAADALAQKLQRGELHLVDIEIWCDGGRDEFCQAGVRSLIRTAEAYSATDLEKAREFAAQSLKLLQGLWDKNLGQVKDDIVGGLSHWKRLDIIQNEDLQKFGVNLPDLSSPLPFDLKELAGTDLKGTLEAARKIKEHPVLSQKLYPLMLVFGSRLKGYAGLRADLDAAIFIKPNVLWKEREAIRSLLKQEIPEIRKMDKILEFWVEEKEGKLGLKMIPEGTMTVVGAPQVHFLLGGVWVGEGSKCRKLQADILSKYLDLSRFEDQKDQVRTYLLRQIELDILQYRLMHKGYRKFYPNRRGLGTKHSDVIDWESDFWDPGYRRVATQLFLSRVFLPDLSA